MLQVAQIMCDNLGGDKVTKPEVPGQFRPLDVRHMCHDVTELLKLGWKQEVTLEEGLKMQCDWIREEHQKREGGLKDCYSELREKQIASGYVKVEPHDSAQSITTSEPNDATYLSEASDHSELSQPSIAMTELSEYDIWLRSL